MERWDRQPVAQAPHPLSQQVPLQVSEFVPSMNPTRNKRARWPEKMQKVFSFALLVELRHGQRQGQVVALEVAGVMEFPNVAGTDETGHLAFNEDGEVELRPNTVSLI